jgi:bifunctional non-homologous end joining protein LigD
MALTEYRRKRNARRTPEPMPRPRRKKRASHKDRAFVVQKHAARHLHYDFRLELDGVLKSWAVPKGPSLDPSEKRLAMQVEDHPLEYADFEGIIPEGEYGGGTVMVWDHGQWEPAGDARKSYEQGRMKFRLDGQKLHGGWALVRMGGRAADPERRQWLLIKERDAEARPADKLDITSEMPDSALTGRSIEQIETDGGQAWESNRVVKKTRARRAKAKAKPARARKSTRAKVTPARDPIEPSDLTNARRAAMPSVIHPQLATLVKEPPGGNQWRHEIKYDGYRIVCMLANRRARLITRRNKNWTAKFARVAAAAAVLPVDNAILDGEVVVLNPDGTTNFQALQNALKDGRGENLVYFIFDLPYCQGYDLSRTPLVERKQLLKQLLARLGDAGVLRYSDDIQGHGEEVFRQACRYPMEGIVSKRSDSPYEQRRTRTWLKVKCISRQEFVIVGYTDPSGARTAFGALLLGYYDKDGELIYCGRVGTGFGERSLRQIHALLRKRVQSRPAVSNPPKGTETRGVHWVRPELVAEVEFSEWTREGILRHPSFLGLRDDKKPREVVREAPEPPSQSTPDGRQKRRSARDRTARRQDADLVVAGVHLTHPDRVLYPEQQLTKAALAEYYTRVADWILPHIVHRPLAIVRCPEGQAKKCFYQKHVSEALPNTIHGVRIREKNQARGEPAAVEIAVSDLAGLVSLVQFGVLEIHPWGAREDNVERPDRLYFDLDPDKGVAWEQVIEAAREMRALLDDLGLKSFVKTSGGKGLHVAVPITRRSDWQEARAFTKAVAERMARAEPQHYLITISKSRRKGRIFIDYLRNTRGATAVAAYSTRARAGAPVSAPLAWDELTPRIGPATYTVQNVPGRLERLKRDPWEGFFQTRQTLSARARSKLGM